MCVIVSFLDDGEQDEEDEKEEKEEEVEEEPEEQSENNDSYSKINVETLISENGDSSTLDLSVKGLVDDDMIIIGNLLKNKKVSKQTCPIENSHIKNCQNIDHLFSFYYWSDIPFILHILFFSIEILFIDNH